MLSRIPRKHKLLALAAIVLAFVAQHFLGTHEDVSKQVRLLEEGSLSAQIEAARTLGEMGSSASPAVSALAKAVTDPDAQLRSAATAALIKINKSEAVRALSGAFTSRDSAVRLDAAEALEGLGTDQAKQALGTYQNKVEERYQRASYSSGIVDRIRRSYEKDEKKKYQRHKRVYGD